VVEVHGPNSVIFWASHDGLCPERSLGALGGSGINATTLNSPCCLPRSIGRASTPLCSPIRGANGPTTIVPAQPLDKASLGHGVGGGAAIPICPYAEARTRMVVHGDVVHWRNQANLIGILGAGYTGEERRWHLAVLCPLLHAEHHHNQGQVPHSRGRRGPERAA
jgi:hypothetical protein